jgi:hypothetical protein
LGCAGPAGPPAYPSTTSADEETYDERALLNEADSLFGEGAEGVAELIERAFAQLGRPNGFIKGEEAAGAVGFGLRYGHGVLTLKTGETSPVYWQGSSIGFDVGGNAAKTFVLVYNLPSVEHVFQRYPGVDGSAYFIGGLGLNYNQSGDVVLAPIRLGVGWRLGASVGYLKLTRKGSLVPF